MGIKYWYLKNKRQNEKLADKCVTHGKYRFWTSMILITIPQLLPFALGVYAARQYGESKYVWVGVGVSLIFLLILRMFEQTIRREGAATGWDEAYEMNGKNIYINDPYPGWSFPRFPD